MSSEFGRGLTYCLGLFLCHSERDRIGLKSKNMEAGLWFNGAGDHLYELEVPDTLPKSLRNRLKKFRNKVLQWRCSIGDDEPTDDDKDWAIHEAKDLLILIDKHFEVKTQKGGWE